MSFLPDGCGNTLLHTTENMFKIAKDTYDELTIPLMFQLLPITAKCSVHVYGTSGRQETIRYKLKT